MKIENTPQDGDFVRYVEQVTTRPIHRAHASLSGDDATAAGLVHKASPTPGSVPGHLLWQANEAPVNDPKKQGFARSMAIVWAVLLLVLLGRDATLAALIALVAGLWMCWRHRQWLLPPGGVADLQAAIDDLRQQWAARQRRGKNES